MFTRQTFKHFLKTDYHGQILTGNYSSALKKRVADHISHFKAFDMLLTPAIPYISAWSDKNPRIWYEFAGTELTTLLKCKASQLARTFNKNIINHSIYKAPKLNDPVTKEIIQRKDLKQSRQRLRDDVKRHRSVEAVYKLSISKNNSIWLKDQATIEIFESDGIYLSLGMLFIVTKEMTAESELKHAKEELRKHRDNLEELVEQRTTEIWRTQLEIVNRLSKAVEFRDKDTGTHITKMSHYCATLSDALGIKKQVGRLLFHATPMHDVGKIGISDKILFKPGKLNKEEFTLMKSHSDIGARLLSGHDSNLMRVARSIALTHHEKWDGSGYPNGLHKKAIPLAGRIVAICDVFDALTSERPYKKAWSFEHAINLLHKGKGTHFDPELVETFINHIPQIKQIYSQQHTSTESNTDPNIY
jgi:HD-GYP domain-containing protein (c-di-GMP phosphodiesterase class II)